jgi:hypothetical protein
MAGMQNKSLLLGQVLCLAALGGVTAAQAAPRSLSDLNH